MPHSICSKLILSFIYEKGIGETSAACISTLFQLILFLSNLGGVPVFNRPIGKSNFRIFFDNIIEDFVTPENTATLLTKEMHAVVDATDSIRAKAAMIAHCKRNKIPIVTVGGAGGQIDPTQVTKGDLAKTTQDPLAAKLRSELRRNYNFSKNPKRRFGVECIYSTEQLRYPQPDGSVCYNKSAMEGGTRLDCAGGFGAVVTVTATFGMFAAASVINRLTGQK